MGRQNMEELQQKKPKALRHREREEKVEEEGGDRKRVKKSDE